MATLEAFDASVRLGSFSRAAEVVHLTPGAVSRQMAALEADLQVALFDRHARGVSPTAAGERLHNAVREALSLVIAATRDLRDGGKAAEEVRLSVSPSFGARWLMPRLGGFSGTHPNIRVVTVADNRLANLDVEHFDLAVRYTSSPDEALEAAFLMGEDLCAVAAPGLLSGSPPVPEALVSLPLLHDKSEEGWRAWLAAVGRPDLQPSKGAVFNDYNLTVEAAAAGLGVAIGRSALIAKELRSGRLSEAGPFRVPSRRAYYLVRPRRRALPAAQILWDWLLTQGRAEERPPRVQVA